MRLLLLTYEFDDSTFSGNGVYAGAQRRALTAADHTVHVIAARPAQTIDGTKTSDRTIWVRVARPQQMRCN